MSNVPKEYLGDQQNIWTVDTSMKVTMLFDNTVHYDRYLIAEHGFSAFIKSHGCRVLFDTGYSGAVITNAEKLGIDLFLPD